MDKSELVIPTKKTKIYSTIGPATNNENALKELVKKGVNAFRLNLSHGTNENKHELIQLMRKVVPSIPVMLDTKGPEIRIGNIPNPIPLEKGSKFTLTIEKDSDYEKTKKIGITYPGFINDVDVGDTIVIDSGKIKAKIVSKSEKDIECEVIIGSENLRGKRHINLQGKKVNMPSITDEDWKDIDFCIEEGIEFIALSFVRTGEDVKQLREYLNKSQKGKFIQIIPKIESYESTLNYEEIIKNSDGIIYARGDLSCEIPFEKVPFLQKKVTECCLKYGKPIILATQIIISMCENIQPTRAECNDVGNSVFDGIDSVMTSDETAEGKYPFLTIETMSNILRASENGFYKENRPKEAKGEIGEFLRLVGKEEIKNIVLIQNANNNYAMKFSSGKFYDYNIFGFSNNETLYRQMNHMWGIIPVLKKELTEEIKNNIKIIDEELKKINITEYLLITDDEFPLMQIRKIL